MNFLLNEEQVLLRDSVRRYVEREYGFDQRCHYIATAAGGEKVLADMAAQGWLAAGLDERFGGFGGGLIESCLIAEELGKAMLLEPYWALAMAPTSLLANIANDSCLAMLGRVLSGDAIVSVALQGILATDIEIVASQLSNGDFVLSGAGASVYGPSHLTHILVAAKLTIDGVVEPALFAIPTETAGLSLAPVTLLDESTSARPAFNQTALPASALLASGAQVSAAKMHCESIALLGMCASAIGVAEAIITKTVAYLKIRKQFNSPIAKFQSLQHRIADMKIALEESRASVHSAISLVASAAGSSLVAVSEAKYIVGKNTSFIAAQGIQLHGAIGLTEEFVIGHYFRAITVFNHLLGTPSAHLRNLASVDDYFDFN